MEKHRTAKRNGVAQYTHQKRRLSEKEADKRRVAANVKFAARITDEKIRTALARAAKLREKVSPEDLNDE